MGNLSDWVLRLLPSNEYDTDTDTDIADTLTAQALFRELELT